MELSSRAKQILGAVPMLLGILAAIISPFYVAGIVVALIGAIIILYFMNEDSKKLKKEKVDYRKKNVNQALLILEKMVSSANYHNITISPFEESKTDLLGNDGARLWKVFYDSVEIRRARLVDRPASWLELEKLNQSCFDSFFKVYNEVSWVKELVPKTRLDNILSKLKTHAVLPTGWQHPV